MPLRLSMRSTALAVAFAAAATIGGAYLFQYVWGYVPCKLCLWQRNPYYAGIVLAILTALVPPPWRRAGLWLLALLFLASAVLGAYHAGVEWGFFAGPSDCGGGAGQQAGTVGDFLNQLQSTRVVSCTEAAWRLLGLSLAGWNVLISLALAALSARAARDGTA